MKNKTDLNTCNKHSVYIAYEGDECPLCQAEQEMIELLDDREDLDQENIFALFKQLKKINKRLDLIDEIVMPQVNFKRWLWHPFRHTKLIKEVSQTSAKQTQPKFEH